MEKRDNKKILEEKLAKLKELSITIETWKLTPLTHDQKSEENNQMEKMAWRLNELVIESKIAEADIKIEHFQNIIHLLKERMSNTVEIKKKIRSLTKLELKELLALVNLVSIEKFKAIQIEGNTALIPRGQEVAKEQDAIARLLENVKNGWTSSKLLECGVPKGQAVNINQETGEITLTETE